MTLPADEQRLREAIASASRLLWKRGWAANHDGNVTVRLDDGRILATPTAVSKRLIGADDVLLLSADGNLLDGQRTAGKPFSELHLHLRCYRERADAKAVVHAHPPTATGFAVAGLALTTPILAEAIVSLGPGAPLVGYALPGSPALEEGLAAALVDADAALLANHGVIAVGVDVEQAYLRVELVEHLATIELAARQLGRVNRLPEADVATLLQKRAAAGLGPLARAAGSQSRPSESLRGADTDADSTRRSPRATVEPPIATAADTPRCGDGPGSLPRPASARSLDPDALERLVRDEIARLRGPTVA